MKISHIVYWTTLPTKEYSNKMPLIVRYCQFENMFPEGAIKNGPFRETGNIGYTRQRKTKQKHNTIIVEHNNMQTNINNTIRHKPLL